MPEKVSYDSRKQLIRVAIVTSKSNEADMHFIETVAYNRERSMKVFLSDAEALDWLQR